MQKTLFFGNTDVGKLRKNNEDAFIIQYIWDKKHILGVAIDGVGGYEGGEVAASIAQENILEYLKRFPNGERINLLKQAVVEANNKIVEERNKNPKLSQMSCVLSACLLELGKQQVNMVHIGDSRVYQFHNGELTKLSHDHSYVGYREDIGDLSEEDAMNHPKRNEINRMIGDMIHNIDDQDFLEAKNFALLPNTLFLLCSDGLTDLVTRTEIIDILILKKSLKEKTRLLIEKANEKGGKDNITVVLIDYQSDDIANIENIKIENESLSNQEQLLTENLQELKTKNRTIKLHYAVLIAILTFLIGVGSAWFLTINHNKSTNIPTKTINSDSTKIDSLNLSDTLLVKQYIHSLKDTIKRKDESMERLKNVLRELTQN